MKKLLSINILCLLLFNFVLKAQTELTFLLGTKGGINLPTFAYSEERLNKFTQDLLPRHLFGLTTEFSTSGNFSFGLEFLYLKRGAYLESSNGIWTNYEFKVDYIDTRIPINYFLGNYLGGIKPYISVSPNIGIPIRGTIDINQYDGWYRTEISNSNIALFNFGIATSLGFSVPVYISFLAKNIFISAEAGYNFGVVNTYSKDELNIYSTAMNVDNYDLRGTHRLHRGIEANIGIKVPIISKIIPKPPKDTVIINNNNNNNNEFHYYHSTHSYINCNCQCNKSCCSLEEIIECLINKKSVCGKLICLGTDLLFNFDKCGIESMKFEGLDSLQKLANILINANFKIKIEGHTDRSGKESHNQYLSQCRAEKVRDYLINNCRVSPQKISSVIGRGTKKPRWEYNYSNCNCVDSGDQSDMPDRGICKKNRRVEIEIICED